MATQKSDLRPRQPLLPRPPRWYPAFEPSLKGSRIKLAYKLCSQRKSKASRLSAMSSHSDHQQQTPESATALGLYAILAIQRSLECSYDVEEGQTRHRSLKGKHEALQLELGNTMEVLWYMQHGPEDAAHTIVARTREGHSLSDILASFALLDLQGKSVVPRSTDIIDSESQTKTTTPRGPTLVSPTVPDRFVPTPISACSDPEFWRAPLRLQRSSIKHAFFIFLQYTTTLFRVYTQEEVSSLLDFSLQEQDAIPVAVLCEAYAVATVGSRYSRSQISPEHGNHFYNVAKQLLDECIERTPIRATKVCTLLAMCSIINKACCFCVCWYTHSPSLV